MKTVKLSNTGSIDYRVMYVKTVTLSNTGSIDYRAINVINVEIRPILIFY